MAKIIYFLFFINLIWAHFVALKITPLKPVSRQKLVLVFYKAFLYFLEQLKFWTYGLKIEKILVLEFPNAIAPFCH